MDNVSPRSRTAAALFAGFLGSCGAHRFYVGKIGTGVLQLVVSGLLFISIIGILLVWIWPVIDFILIVSGNFTDKEGRKLMVW